jgi:hypothetical protein
VTSLAFRRAAPALAAVIYLTITVGAAGQQIGAPESYRQMVPGLLSRSVSKTEAGTVTIEIVDLLVGPNQRSEPINLQGGAMLDVQAGNAALLVDGKQKRVRPGEVMALAQGQRVAIDNSRESRAFVVRLILFSSRS